MLKIHRHLNRPFFAALLGLCLAVLVTEAAHAEQARTPQQLIDQLGLDIRQILEGSGWGKTPEEAERAVADQITAMIRSDEGHLSLSQPGLQGRTPLMQAASDGYPLIVQALLAAPGVRLRINAPDETGATAWMLAGFAPSLTLAACQPGALTIERYPLLPPYLKRMGHLLKTKGAAIGAIVRALEDAGAEVKPEEATQAWLKRCPNAAPELRQALAEGDLMPTLVNHAIKQQLAFNKAADEDPKRIPAEPPEGMNFLRGREGTPINELPKLLQIEQLNCVSRDKPRVGQINWRGTIVFRAVAATRAGIVEVADFDVLTPKQPPKVVDHFRASILRALAGYRCAGEHVFEQEFQFVIS